MAAPGAASAADGPLTVGLPGPGPFAGRVPVRATIPTGADITRVEFRVRGALVAVDETVPFATEIDTSTLADGTADVTAVATDAEGRTHTSDPVSTVLDNTLPTLTVTGPDRQVFAPGLVQSWTITASDATAGVRGVRCALVAGGAVPVFDACPSSGAYSARDLPDGFYTLIVRAFDRAGNFSEVTRRFAIDATPPLTRFATGPRDGAAFDGGAASFGFESNEPGARFECRLAPAPFAPCTAPLSLTGLAPGDYTVEVRSIDTVGNVDTTPARRTFTVLAPLADPAVVAPPVTPTAGPAPAATPEQLTFALVYKFTAPTARHTRLVSLVATQVPSGATVTATLGKKKLVRAERGGRATLTALVGKALRPGARIRIQVTRPGALSATKVLHIRSSKAPRVT